MIRFLKLLAVALVLQLTWGVASAYCMHESGEASQHFGHHEHQHQSSDVDDDEGSTSGKYKPHPDCASCTHAQLGIFSLDVGTMPVSVIGHSAAPPPIAQLSPFLGMPERPQWIHAD